jgi:hypothetical protein
MSSFKEFSQLGASGSFASFAKDVEPIVSRITSLQEERKKKNKDLEKQAESVNIGEALNSGGLTLGKPKTFLDKFKEAQEKTAEFFGFGDRSGEVQKFETPQQSDLRKRQEDISNEIKSITSSSILGFGLDQEKSVKLKQLQDEDMGIKELYKGLSSPEQRQKQAELESDRAGAIISSMDVGAPNILKQIAKTTNKKLIGSLIKGRVPDEAIDGLKSVLADAKSDKAVKSILDNAKNTTLDNLNYINDVVKKQEEAKGAGDLTFTDKIKKVFRNVKSQLVDSTSIIEDTLSKSQKDFNFKVIPAKDVSYQIDRVLSSPRLAGQFMKDNGLGEIIQKVDNIDAFNQYLIARQAKDVAKNGIETGRDLLKDDELIKFLSPVYEKQAKKVTEYSHKLLDYSVDSGLISKELSDKLKEVYPNYVPINRVFSELEQDATFGGSRAIASLSNQDIVKKLQGSTREIENPLDSLLAKTNDAFTQGEKNKAAQMLTSYHSLPGNPFGLEPLRTAENVQKRIDILSKLKETFKEKRSFIRNGKTVNKEIKVADKKFTEIFNSNENNLVKKLGTKFSKTQIELEKLVDHAQTVASDFGKSSDINSLLSKVDTRERKLHRLNADLSSAIAKFNDQKAKNLSERFQTLKDIQLKRKALDVLLDARNASINTLKDELSDVKDITKLAGDQTISVLRNGINEVWKTTPEIAQSAKSLGVQQMNILGKIMSVPVRVLKLGTTGVSLPFAAANVVKDQLSSFINNSNALKTTIAQPQSYVKALFNAVKHGELYDDLVRNAAGGTSFDIARDQVKETVEKIRANKGAVEKAKYLVKNPTEMFRAVENAFSRTEEFSRLQSFEGAKQAALKSGRTLEDANLIAAKAARENSVNFMRRGEFGTVLNNFIPYLNASIQGARTLIRSFQKNPTATTAKLATVIYTPMAISTAWNLGDDKRRKAYEDIQDYEKENNFIIVPPNPEQDENGKWNVIKIPLPPGISDSSMIVRRAIEQSLQ